MDVVLVWAFVLQLGFAAALFAVSGRVAAARKGVWGTSLGVSLGLMLLWPLLRVFPAAAIDLLGARLVMCVELTALVIPAALFFGVAGRKMPRKRDGRAVMMLTGMAAVYFVRAGWWMVAQGVGDVGPTRIDASGVCRQTTGYTCVAASMVTMLRSRGIPAEEEEMARLSHTQVDGGATDSRALWALEQKLTTSGLKPAYRRMDRAGLIAAAKPCLVQINWGFFVSHMVPVMNATDGGVTIGDPIGGTRVQPWGAFEEEWKGMGIVLERAR